jgi:hypothetical protein
MKNEDYGYPIIVHKLNKLSYFISILETENLDSELTFELKFVIFRDLKRFYSELERPLYDSLND